MKPSYYAIIIASVRYDNSLPPNAKLLYGEISALANQKGFCYASNKYFADLYGVNEKTISDWIKKLKDGRHIYCESEANQNRKIYINADDRRRKSRGGESQFPESAVRKSRRPPSGFPDTRRQDFLTHNSKENTTENNGEDKSSQSYELEPTDNEGNPITPRGKSKTVPLLRRIE